jgi:type I restriction enzyme R subunit
MPTPEEIARQQIDEAMDAAGWDVQNVEAANVHAARGVAIREFPLKHGHGLADYLLYVDGKAAGVVEAKKAGTTLTGVEIQAAKYSEGLPDALPAHQRPLPFLYQSTGVETRFTNWLDPEPRSRRVFHFHRPETLARWLAEFPSSLRKRLRDMPPLVEQGLWPAQIKLLLWEEDGYAIWYKRLEKGSYRFPAAADGAAQVEVRAADLVMLLAGVDLASVRRSRRYHRPVPRRTA